MYRSAPSNYFATVACATYAAVSTFFFSYTLYDDDDEGRWRRIYICFCL